MNEETEGINREEVEPRSRNEARIWAGFALAFFIVFIFILSAWEKIQSNMVGGLITIAMGAGLLNHGFWDHDRIMMAGATISISVTAILLATNPALFPVGMIILGVG